MKLIPPAGYRSSKYTLVLIALLASSSLLNEGGHAVQCVDISSNGIFDRLEKKMGEKERKLMEMQ